MSDMCKFCSVLMQCLKKTALPNNRALKGYLKEDMFIKGEYRDSVLMAILKTEFKS
ncbi:MAG: hypothetical protein OXH36_01295 [Bdellovibrionales bacterium]|nr:hypothetical protein [Bdellovibrionales bacterium]